MGKLERINDWRLFNAKNNVSYEFTIFAVFSNWNTAHFYELKHSGTTSIF